ncbi:MAG: hypothetical protein Q8N53_07745, partial [Longimicrobiales bacterium]|nr:hypothetical protein [Longimicrobiales bacterium]
WVTFRDEGWPLALRHPQSWTVAVEEDVGGRRVLVRARDRSLTIHRRGGMPADLPPEWSKVQIGPLPARKHVRRDVDGMLREVVVVPGQASEWPSAVSYALAGLREDEEYMRLFDALLGTVEFGPQAALPGTR